MIGLTKPEKLAFIFDALETAGWLKTAVGKSIEQRLAEADAAEDARPVSLLKYQQSPSENDVGAWIGRALDDGKRSLYLPYKNSGYEWLSPVDAEGAGVLLRLNLNSIALVGGLAALSNVGLKSRVMDAFIVGDRTPGQIFSQGMGPTSVHENISIDRVDIGFKMTSGFEPVFSNIYGRNCKTALFHFRDGVGPILRGATYDTDGPWYTGKAAGITRSGDVATVTTTQPHGFITGQSVTIMGAAQAAYNGAFTVTVTGANSFAYPVAGSPSTPATPVAGGSGVIIAYPTATTYALPSKGAIWLQTEGAVITGMDAIHGGMVIEAPSDRDVTWALVSDSYFDSGNDQPGVDIINNTATRKITGLWFDQVWSATGIYGFRISGSCPKANIDGVFIADCPIHNNVLGGVRAEKGVNIVLSNSQIIGNDSPVNFGASLVKGGPAYQVFVGSQAEVRVKGGEIQGKGLRWTTSPAAHVYVEDGGVGFVDYNVDMDDNCAARVVNNSASFADKSLIGWRSYTRNELLRIGGAPGGNLWIEDLGFGRVDLRGTSPSFNLYASGATVGRKFSRVTSSETGEFYIQALDDGYGIQNTAFALERGGAGFVRARLDLPVAFRPGASVTPANNGEVMFELTNNSTITFRAKGSDGVVRAGSVALT